MLVQSSARLAHNAGHNPRECMPFSPRAACCSSRGGTYERRLGAFRKFCCNLRHVASKISALYSKAQIYRRVLSRLPRAPPARAVSKVSFKTTSYVDTLRGDSASLAAQPCCALRTPHLHRSLTPWLNFLSGATLLAAISLVALCACCLRFVGQVIFCSGRL